MMSRLLVPATLAALIASSALAQEPKPVPKDSVRISIPGCSRNYIFTAGHPTEDQPGGSAVPEGTRLRMNGSKKLMAEIKGQEGSRVEITGLIKKGQSLDDGVAIGRGVRVGSGSGAPAVGLGGGLPSPGGGVLMIDVEGWRRVGGDCPR
jgi:hypothetical protein